MATTKKDMRRDDLAIPFVEPEKDKEGDMTSTISTTLPMMAMFTRNKIVAWVAVAFSVQTWLAETPESRKTTATPGYLSVIMAIIGLLTSYVTMFLPGAAIGGTAAQPPAPQP